MPKGKSDENRKPSRTTGGTRGHGTGSGSGLRHPEFRSKSDIDRAFAQGLIDSAMRSQLYRIKKIKAAQDDTSGLEAQVENMTDPKKMK